MTEAVQFLLAAGRRGAGEDLIAELDAKIAIARGMIRTLGETFPELPELPELRMLESLLAELERMRSRVRETAGLQPPAISDADLEVLWRYAMAVTFAKNSGVRRLALKRLIDDFAGKPELWRRLARAGNP